MDTPLTEIMNVVVSTTHVSIRAIVSTDDLSPDSVIKATNSQNIC